MLAFSHDFDRYKSDVVEETILEKGKRQMKISLPVKVGLMDDDFFALHWNAELISRDIRTSLVFAANTLEELEAKVGSSSPVDALILDVEYWPEMPRFSDLLANIRNWMPEGVLVCLSQYGDAQKLDAAISAGASSFLLKHEVGMSIVSAVIASMQNTFLVTPGLLKTELAENNLALHNAKVFSAWVANPYLTPKLKQVFTMRVLYGMTAPFSARKIHLAPATIEKYMQYVYEKMSKPWGEKSYLLGADLTELSPEIEAFHLYSLPPKRN
jgi:DNA-binding NarL/FixJ family response regulator